MANVTLLFFAAATAVTSAQLPEGFSLTQVAEADNARQMAWGNRGTLFVGSRKAGKVHALQDLDDDGVYETRHLVAEGLYLPSGIAFRDNTLYVAAVNRILAFPDVENRLVAPKMKVVYDGLPSDAHHGWKFIRFAPDGRLIVPVGAPCNICNPELPYASIVALDLDRGQYEILARGVRNSVGFDFHPDSGDLYFSDNGRDLMGDDLPPDEINRLTTPGGHFGYPFLHGADVADPKFKASASQMAGFERPLWQLQAHVAPLGIHFYRGKAFPQAYRGGLFIAEHGSWNRSSKVGYQVSALLPQADGGWHYEVIIGPWLDGEQPLARPVAFLEHPDGSLLISDDYNGAVYKLTYNGMPAQTADNENNE